MIEVEDRFEDNNLYFVTSIYMNAYLLSKGFEIEKTGILHNGKVALFYKNTDKLHKAMADYRNNKELSNFVTNYLKVKDIINLHKEGDNNTAI